MLSANHQYLLNAKRGIGKLIYMQSTDLNVILFSGTIIRRIIIMILRVKTLWVFSAGSSREWETK